MPGPASLPNKTRNLLDRIEHGDRLAAYDLARLYRPDDITDLIELVCPDRQVPSRVFDALADAYAMVYSTG